MNRGKYICSLAKKLLLSKMTDEKTTITPKQVNPGDVQSSSSHILECSETVLEQPMNPGDVQPSSSHMLECSEIVLEQPMNPGDVQPSSSHMLECSEIVLEQSMNPGDVQPSSSHMLECSEIVLEQSMNPGDVQPSSSHMLECSEIVLEQPMNPGDVQPSSSHMLECSEIVLEQPMNPGVVQPSSSHMLECSMNPEDEVVIDYIDSATTADEMDTTSCVIFDDNLSAFVDNTVISVSTPTTSNTETCRPKKGRKLKHGLSRKQSQVNRNSNKSYINYKGIKKNEKPFNAYSCSCSMNCHDVVPVEERKMEHDRYWSLGSYNAQTAYLGNLVAEKPKKRCYGRDINKRQFSRVYTLSQKVVCKMMFCQTLNVCGARITTALKKCGNRQPLLDQRGIRQGGQNKIPEERVADVVAQINKIPKYVSHYCRKETTAEYLPPEMTLVKMYDLYKEEINTPVSFETYKKIFNERFNLKFKTLKKDTCNSCDSYKAKISTEKCDTKRASLCAEQARHQELAKGARDLLKSDIALAKSNVEVECLTFDMQKTLPLPRIPTNIIYYKRQLCLYNLGIHAGKSGRSYCYCWIEGTAGRGAQEIGSCIRKHLGENPSPDVKELILWADSCGGQNRNIKITLIMKSILENHSTLNTITIKFLYSGHSYLPNDKDFGDIECNLKRQQRLYTPEDYFEVMKSCRKRNALVVKKIEKEDFISSSKIEKHIVNRKTDTEGHKINWMNFREIRLKKDEKYTLYVKTDFNEAYRCIDLQRRGRNTRSEVFENLLVPLWPDGKPISEPKLKDIRSILYLIPQDALDFYTNLTSIPEAVDDIDGYNGVDFDVEYLDD